MKLYPDELVIFLYDDLLLTTVSTFVWRFLELFTMSAFNPAACLIQGTQFALDPTMDTSYGKDVPNECNAMLMRRSGLNILSLGVNAYCLLFKGYDVKVSAAMNTLMWVADTLSSLLNKKFEIIRPAKSGDAGIIAFTSIVAYSALNNCHWFGTTAFKVNAVYTVVAALSCLVSPSLGVKLWEVKEDDELSPGYPSICGAMTGKASTMLVTLARGVDPLTAVGDTCALHVGAVLNLKTFFFTPNVDKIGFDKHI